MTQNRQPATFELKEDGIHISKGKRSIIVSYEEPTLPWEAARKWCRARGMRLGSPSEWSLIFQIRSELNKVLKEIGREPIRDNSYWTSKKHKLDPHCACSVGVYSFNHYNPKNFGYGVRGIKSLGCCKINE